MSIGCWLGPGGHAETMTATESFWIQTMLKRQQVQENFTVADPDSRWSGLFWSSEIDKRLMFCYFFSNCNLFKILS
jgi:hypothetical protein